MKTLKHLLTTLAWIMTATIAGAATVTWDGGGGNLHWTNALNWSGNVLPGPADDVVIGAGSGTVLFSGTSTKLRSLACSRSLSVAGGLLNPTNGFTMASGTSLAVSGAGSTFEAAGTTTFNSTCLVQNGGIVRLPALAQVVLGQQVLWDAYDMDSLLDLSGVTNVVGNAQDLYPRAYRGGKVDLRRAQFTNANTYFLAQGTGSVLDLSALSGELRARAGGSGQIYAESGGRVTVGPLAGASGLDLKLAGATSVFPVEQLGWVTNCTLRLYGVTNDLAALRRMARSGFDLQQGAQVSAAGVTNIDDSSLTLQHGSLLRLTNVTRVELSRQVLWDAYDTDSLLDLSGVTNVVGNAQDLYPRAYRGGKVDLRRAQFTNANTYFLAQGPGSVLDLSGLRAVGGAVTRTADMRAESGGKIDMRNVESISGGTCRVISDGNNSEINLSSLSAFATPLGVSELTAKNGGVIILSGNVFLLANVAVNLSGHPVLPPFVSPGAAVSLYGVPWLSHWVEVRDTRDPASPWELFMRVPLTNAIQVISGPPKSWQAFRVHAFVADPAILDLNRLSQTDVQLVLYGAPPKSFAVQTTNSLDVQPAGWTTYGTTGVMTNSFRIFPPFKPTEAKRFYRGKEL
jgi:hypothetical protein